MLGNVFFQNAGGSVDHPHTGTLGEKGVKVDKEVLSDFESQVEKQISEMVIESLKNDRKKWEG